jgi:hypothetical protein
MIAIHETPGINISAHTESPIIGNHLNPVQTDSLNSGLLNHAMRRIILALIQRFGVVLVLIAHRIAYKEVKIYSGNYGNSHQGM